MMFFNAAVTLPLSLMLLFATSPCHSYVFNVCLVVNPGFVYCDPGSGSSVWHGRAVDLMRYFARQWDLLELNNDPVSGVTLPTNSSGRNMFYFNCTPYQATDILTLMSQDADGSFCSIAMGAIAITQSRYEMPNLAFSIPYSSSGLGIMIAQNPVTDSYSMWGFLKPFNWTLWTALLVTLAILPIIIYVVENLVRTGSIPVQGWSTLQDLQLCMYKTILTIFTVDVVNVLTLPSQIILVCYCFTNLVVVATYTANLVTYLQGIVVVNGIQSISDLINTEVYANDIYLELLKQSDYLLATPLAWNGLDTFNEVFEGLTNGSMTAYITDYPKLLVYQQLYDSNCQLTFLPQIEQIYYGVAIHDALPAMVTTFVNEGILSAQSDGTLTRLQRIYFSNNVCTPSLPASDVLFSQLSGLWVILGCAVALGILFSLHGIWKHHVIPAHLEAQQNGVANNDSPSAVFRKKVPSMRTVASSFSKVLVNPKKIKSARNLSQAQAASHSSRDLEEGRTPLPKMESFMPYADANGSAKLGHFQPHCEKLQEMHGGGETSEAAVMSTHSNPSYREPLSEEGNNSRRSMAS